MASCTFGVKTVPKRASMSEMRLLTADGAMKARSPARAMVPSSQTTMNRFRGK